MVETTAKSEERTNKPILSKLEERLEMLVKGGAPPSACAVLAEALARGYARDAEEAAKYGITVEAIDLLNKSADYWILTSQFNLSCGKALSVELITRPQYYIISLTVRVDCSEDRQDILGAIRSLWSAQQEFVASTVTDPHTTLAAISSDKTVSSAMKQSRDGHLAKMRTYLFEASSKYEVASLRLEDSDPKKAVIYSRYADKLRQAAQAAEKGRFELPWDELSIDESLLLRPSPESS
ncbi:MAG: hypothetical protein LVQ95_04075 [Candidatus Micrarchaeales archaeon]|nr:hypothetical protein [Candidatus Micrarchaeales archaeon]